MDASLFPSSSRREIGGFCGLELPQFGNFPQREGVYVNSGRAAFEYILRALGDVRKVYLPLYTCHTLGETLARLGIVTELYSIDDRLEIAADPVPAPARGEYVLYTDYFGLKLAYVHRLNELYPGRLIVDNCLALYSPSLPNTPTFFSPRKFSGLPDGGVAIVDGESPELPERDVSSSTASFLLQALEYGIAATAEACEENERRLARTPLAPMSRLTELLINSIDYERAALRRTQNYRCLHRFLGSINKLAVPEMPRGPFCYPFRTNVPELRNYLIDRGIYIPVLWPHLLGDAPAGSIESKLVRELIPLPVDQRYGTDEMREIVAAIRAFMRGD